MVTRVLYNVTIKMDPEIEEDWLEWMKMIHIPDVMSTGFFDSYRLTHLLFQDDSDGKTFAIQYVCKSLSDLEKYQELYAPELQRAHIQRYEGRFAAFRTILQVLDES